MDKLSLIEYLLESRAHYEIVWIFTFSSVMVLSRLLLVINGFIEVIILFSWAVTWN